MSVLLPGVPLIRVGILVHFHVVSNGCKPTLRSLMSFDRNVEELKIVNLNLLG
jgi:hypothetical protein